MDNIAKITGAKPATREQVFADKTIDAVVICSPTDTHADLCIARAPRPARRSSARSRSISSLERVDACLAAVAGAGVPMMVGFNRRFDPSFRALKARLDEGEIGTLEQVDHHQPRPRPAAARLHQGLGRPVPRHDDPRFRHGALAARRGAGRGLRDRQLRWSTRRSAKAGDIDTAMVVLRTASGKLVHINNSRRASLRLRPAHRGVRRQGHAARRQRARRPRSSSPTARASAATSRCTSSSSATRSPIASSSRRSSPRSPSAGRCR